MSMIRFDNTKSGTANDLVERLAEKFLVLYRLIPDSDVSNGKIRGTDFLLAL